MPVDQIGTTDVLAVLTPLWTRAPVTGSRLRGRIEKVLDAERARGHIDRDRANPARWKGHLDLLLPKPAKLSRGHHTAMPYADLPAFMARLRETPGVASQALMFTILTCARTGETLGMQWDEIDLERAIWSIPKERMKMNRPHEVPLSDAAVAIVRAQEAERGKNPFVFPGRPQRPLSNMSMAMLLRRMKVDVTVHGMRSAARSWMAGQGVAFELAESCLAHVVGNAVVQAYQRSSMLERRRPIMSAWSAYVCGADASNVIPLRAHERAERHAAVGHSD
jgi:integrase